ncbi:MAG: ParB/RepB/Spo0J family partition protein [Pirellulales bacterium]|nr:ParB/RepB/Spo0J family partition protein [Pirellulales bacterium]
MGKDRRLGRGLAALLGQLPARNEPNEQTEQEQSPESADTPRSEELRPQAAAKPSAEAMFWLDQAHQTPGRQVAQPHTSPERVAQPAMAAQATHPQTAKATSSWVNVRQIDSNPAQPRQEFDPAETSSLAESISTHGLLQPVVVRRVHNRYQLVAGERRLRAAIQAGWVDVPVSVVEADDRQMAELAIVENLQRKDLNPLEKAASFQKYLEQYGCTQDELAGRLKMDRSTIANLIRLLELPERVKDAIRRGEITQGHARALLPLGDPNEQIEFCRRIVREGLNVRQTEGLVQETIDAADREPLDVAAAKPARPARAKNEQIAALEQEFRAALGMKVKIAHNARGRGQLVVHFRDHDEFERLKRHVCGD